MVIFGHWDLEWFLFSTCLSWSTYNFSTLNNLLPFIEKNTFKAIFPPWGDSRSCPPHPPQSLQKTEDVFSESKTEGLWSGERPGTAEDGRTVQSQRVSGCRCWDGPVHTTPVCTLPVPPLHSAARPSPSNQKTEALLWQLKRKKSKDITYPGVSPTKRFNHMAPQWSWIDKPPIT